MYLHVDVDSVASFVTLTLLEIVLGIDNLIFISIVAGRLPIALQARARTLGLSLALITRLALLASVSWLVGLTQSAFQVAGHSFSWRDLVLAAGGLFLLYKATVEIHDQIDADGDEESAAERRAPAGMAGTIGQILLLDVIFSIDSVITAVGMADNLLIMSAAVIVAVMLMIFTSGPISRFVDAHPTIKMLALAFLLMIGMVLVADGVGFHIPKGFIYTAMAFSIGVESLNMLARRNRRDQSR